MNIITSILYIILAICVLLFMITIHEFGHYTAGKLLKFKINEFSIGFGKAIFSKLKKNGEKFSIRLFPLGGYCAFEGEDEDNKDNKDAFNNQKAWKRLIVLFMGAFFNFLSAIIFAIIFLMAFGYSDRVQVKNVNFVPSYVNTQDWLMEGDVIHAVNGVETNFVYDEYFLTLTSNYELGSESENYFIVSVYRNNKNIDLKIWKNWVELDKISTNLENNSPAFTLDGNDYNLKLYAENFGGENVFKFYKGNYYSGIKTYTVNNLTSTVDIDGTTYLVDTSSVTDLNNLNSVTISSVRIGVLTQNYRYGFFEAVSRSFVFCFGWAWKILIILWQLICGKLALTSMGGTVTTIVTIAQVSRSNIASLLLLIPLISINLSVFNLLPFPALDGARMVFVLIEMIRKKPINRKVEGTIHFIGLMVLLAFVVIVDIIHFVM